jgi:hypothetical protein
MSHREFHEEQHYQQAQIADHSGVHPKCHLQPPLALISSGMGVGFEYGAFREFPFNVTKDKKQQRITGW